MVVFSIVKAIVWQVANYVIPLMLLNVSLQISHKSCSIAFI